MFLTTILCTTCSKLIVNFGIWYITDAQEIAGKNYQQSIQEQVRYCDPGNRLVPDISKVGNKPRRVVKIWKSRSSERLTGITVSLRPGKLLHSIDYKHKDYTTGDWNRGPDSNIVSQGRKKQGRKQATKLQFMLRNGRAGGPAKRSKRKVGGTGIRQIIPAMFIDES